jgi:ABC-type multidrug transport system ATPase subunit
LEIHCELSDLGCQFGKKRLFRNLNARLQNGKIHLITGPNGSGKSTLLRLLSSAMETEEGSIRYTIEGREPDEESLRNGISLVAPYQELPEEFSLAELIAMQHQFLPEGSGSMYSELTSRFGMEDNLHRTLSNFSTGMKQKARFILALGMNRPVWLLDEPGSNLDVPSCAILHALLQENMQQRLIVLASNDPAEISLGEVAVSL